MALHPMFQQLFRDFGLVPKEKPVTSTHKIDATIGMGDPDIGAEVELRITYTFTPAVPEQGPSYSSGGQPAEGATVEFVSCLQILGGKVYEQSGSFSDYQQGSLDTLAHNWLESDEGEAQAIEQALDDLQGQADDAAERRAEQRAEDRREDR